MDTRKVLGIIFSILFVGAFTFVLCWGIINFNKVKDSMSSTGVYTEQDVNNAYQDGYDTALQDKQSYDELINSYRDTITTLTDQISQLSSQVTNLTNANKDYSSQITNLENQKSNLESQVENLTTIKTDNEILISDLNVQVANLQSEVSRLENSGYNNEQELAQKNAQITSLQNTITQLQKTNELNVQTINNLNNQVTSLNSQISEMTLQIQNNSTNVSSLNNKIAELEKSVAYYEQYVASLENGEQVVATFEFNGSVYNIQIVNPNSLLSVTTPISTEYVIFNYWTVNGVEIDLSTYKISQNTKIVADVTYRYKTEFIVNDEVYNSQIVTLNDFATLPTNPNISGYDFDGWTLNGVDIVNPTTIEITEDTKFIAKFTKLHTVTFVYEDSIQDTQIVRNGNFASNVIIEDTIYKNFESWTLNGTVVDVDTYKIVADTTFVANITYSYDVKFIVDNETYDSQIVQNNYYAVQPSVTPEKNRYKCIGWSLDGINVIDVTNTPITSNTEFICIWVEKVGFDNEFLGVNTALNYSAGIYTTDEYIIGVDSNAKNLILIDRETLNEESFVGPTGSTSTSMFNLYLYNNCVYFTMEAGGNYGKLYKFDLATKAYTKMIGSFNRAYSDVVYYNNMMFVIGGQKHDYDAIAYYGLYDLSSNEVISNLSITKVSDSFYYSGGYSAVRLCGNYVIVGGKDTSLQYSSYRPNAMLVFDIITATYKIVQLTSSYSYQPSFYFNGENLYISYKNQYALYDFENNIIGEFVSNKPYNYCFISDTHKFVITSTSQFIIIDNNGNETVVDLPIYNNSTKSPMHFEKISDTQYLAYINIGNYQMTYCYLWL